MANLILVAVDFEEASRRAIDLAKELAGPLGAEVALLHVYELPIYSYPGLESSVLPGFHVEVTEAARRSLDELAAEVGVTQTFLREGDAVTRILEIATERRPAMILMGTHGRRGLAHALLGSVAENVIRACSVPVLTVRGRAA
jgi:nucleotide-binding universal stress UspA family protein